MNYLIKKTTKGFILKNFLTYILLIITIISVFIYIDGKHEAYKNVFSSLNKKSVSQVVADNNQYYKLEQLSIEFDSYNLGKNKVYYIGRDNEWLYIQMFYMFYPTLPKEFLLTSGDIRPVKYLKKESDLVDKINEYGMTSEIYEGGADKLDKFLEPGDIIISSTKIELLEDLFQVDDYNLCYVYTKK